jgi:hypothetical protein
VASQRPLSAVSKVQNSFRPFFKALKKRPFWKEMQSVRQQTLPADYARICTVTEDNPAYPFPGIGNTFPALERTVPNSSFRSLKPLTAPVELALQVARLNHHKAKLAAALQSLGRINQHLANQEFEEAESAIAAHKEAHGLSFVVLKKELLLALEKHGLAGLSNRYKELTSGYESTAWSLLCYFVHEWADPTFNAGRAMRNWLALTARRMERNEWYARLLQDEILTQSPNDAALSSALLRFSAVSLLDLAILLWRKRAVHPQHAYLQSAFSQLDHSITDVLIANFSRLEVHVPSAYRLSNAPPADIEVYRTSFFFEDIASVAAWRCHVNGLLFAGVFEIPSLEHQEDARKLRAAAVAITEKPQRCQECIDGLLAWEKSFLYPSSELSDQKLLKAAVVAESLRNMQHSNGGDPASVSHLLATTEDVHMYVSSETLKCLLNTQLARASPILCFILREMIYRKNRKQDDELERRLAFMTVFKGGSGTQIVKLLDELALQSLETATLLARSCTRTFLERLYLMMTSVKDVLETRLSICRWLRDHAGEVDESLEEECDALERESANLEARSDLDSTRVHVDEESLREWFNETQLARATRYIQTVLAEDPSKSFGSLLTFYSNRDKSNLGDDEEDFTIETQIGSEFLFVAIVDATLSAFASDRIFGLDAYLSRRIRHGTLSGHVMTPVSRALKRLSERSDPREQAHSGIASLVQEWRKFLVNELDYVRKDVIQVKTEIHPNGLIQATWKSAANIAHLDAMISRVRGRVIEAKGAYDIFPDIYSLCWDCLESDLAQLRLYMIRKFLPSATNKLKELFEQLTGEERALAHSQVQELYAILNARIQDVCGWFIRPVFRRDHYSLKMLSTSTLSIVRELDERYAFNEAVAIPDEISLNRGGFDVFGDALFVLIGNAARHGKPDGNITVSAKRLEGRNKMVLISVTSEVADVERHREAVSRIRSAVNPSGARSLDRAAVEEGFSGLGKLVGLLQRVRSPYVTLKFVPSEDDLTISFLLGLPAEITFTRERP